MDDDQVHARKLFTITTLERVEMSTVQGVILLEY